MRFRIYRTSDFGSSECAPVEGAVKDESSVRRWGTALEYVWYLEIPDLAALLDMVRQTPECRVVLDSEPAIEIYDDYRE